MPERLITQLVTDINEQKAVRALMERFLKGRAD
jgi:hypothetical protein